MAVEAKMREVATPSRLGMKIGKRVTGFDFELYMWLRYAEQVILRAIMCPEQTFVILNVPPRAGKALAVDTPIPTPDGWKSMGQLATGNLVFGPDGSTASIIAHEPYEAETFEVTFDDGSSIVVDGRHLWTTIDKQHSATWTEHRGAGWADDWWSWVAPGKGAGGRVKGHTKEASGRPRSGSTSTVATTLELREAMKAGAVPRIPNGRIGGDDVDLPIDPYLLGYWLGDGTTSEPAITVGLDDADELVERCGEAGCDVSVAWRDYRPSTKNIRLLKKRAAFTALGLLGNKHIPDIYMRANWAQRRALLAGILDADGSEARGAADIGQQNEQLARDIAELVTSLGGKVSSTEHPARLNGELTGATVYRQRIVTTFNPFQLKRKADAWDERATSAKMGLRGQRIITSIEPTGRTETVRCLTTSHPSSLYLAGRQMVPTHNTTYSGMFLPAWFLGMFPALRAIFVSYGDDYSVKYGRAVRTIIDKFGRELFGVGVDKSAQSASDWQMSGTFGGMLSTGVGGVLTGYGGNLIVIDDIIKNTQEAKSEATKKGHVEWYQETLRSRLEPGGTMLLTATRWAEDDLTGWLLERQAQAGYTGDRWEVLAFPALAEPGEFEQYDDITAWRDMLGRKVGESLNPERFPAHVYEQIRATIEAMSWSCVYQQSPSPPVGGMFPRNAWMHYNGATLPQISRRVRVWDLAASAESGDWTVGVLLGIASTGDVYVLERERFQRASHEVEDAVKAAATRDGFGVTIIIEQEKAGAGKTVVEHYQRLLPGFTVKPGKVDGSKEERATPYSAMQQRRRVWLPEGAEWLEEWKKEHRAMIGDGRRGRHDDQIDAAAFGVRELLSYGSSDIYIPGEFRLLSPAETLGSANVIAFPGMDALEAQVRELRGVSLVDAILRSAA